jgi:predicted methyltransferase
MAGIRLVRGDAIEGLVGLEPESLDVVVSSPHRLVNGYYRK